MTRLDAIIAERTDARRRIAEAASQHAVATLRGRNVDIRVFGSLARGGFMAHSDVDFLVTGPVDRAVRVDVERTVAQVMAETALPYDIIYLTDLSPEQAAAFDRG